MSRIVRIKGAIEFLPDGGEVLRAKVVDLIRDYMDDEFAEVVADLLDRDEEADRALDEMETQVWRLERELEQAKETIDWLRDTGYRPMRGDSV